jgi:3-dehydroquinate dehydratase type I
MAYYSTMTGVVTPDILNNNERFLPQLQQCAFLEIRYDLFDTVAQWHTLARQLHELVPSAQIIGTIRLQQDGGNFANDSKHARLDLWKDILEQEHTPDWIDVEVESVEDISDLRWMCYEQKTKIILSHHSFTTVPEVPKILEWLDLCRITGAAAIKVACMPELIKDLHPIWDSLQQYKDIVEKICIFGMGQAAKNSRLITALCWDGFCYVSLGEQSVAPGQWSVSGFSAAMHDLPKDAPWNWPLTDEQQSALSAL